MINLETLSRELIDSGKLIEAGWTLMRIACVSPDATPDQLHALRIAFFGGAQHLFGTIMTVLEPGDEPTEKDMMRMDLIDAELKKFIRDFEMRYLPTKGTA